MLHAIMQSDAVYRYPIWAVGVSLAAGAVAGALFLQILLGRLVHPDIRRQHNDSTAAIISIVGVTYAVLLSFVAMLALDTYDAAKAAAGSEAGRLADLARVAKSLDGASGAALHGDLVAYAEAVEDVEWPMQAEGRVSHAADAPLDRADAVVAALKPTDLAQANVQAELIKALTRLHDARNDRLAAVERSIPGIVWFVVVAGGAITLVMTALLGVSSVPLHYALTALVALSGALILVLIVALSHPFRGDFRVTPEPFARVLGRMSGP